MQSRWIILQDGMAQAIERAACDLHVDPDHDVNPAVNRTSMPRSTSRVHAIQHSADSADESPVSKFRWNKCCSRDINKLTLVERFSLACTLGNIEGLLSTSC